MRGHGENKYGGYSAAPGLCFRFRAMQVSARKTRLTEGSEVRRYRVVPNLWSKCIMRQEREQREWGR